MIVDMEQRSKSCKEFTKINRRDKPMKVADALHIAVSKASCEGRLVTGITEIAAVLQRVPASSVMFCVLENKNVEDIQMMLLEAFCTEYKIKLIKVDDGIGEDNFGINTSKSVCDHIKTGTPTCKFTFTANNLTDKDSEDVTADDTSRSTCLLLKQPLEFSSEEEFILAFYETYRYCKNAYPVIRLSGREFNP